MVKKVNTSELIGPALDWAQAKCEGHDIDSLMGGAVWYWLRCSLTGDLEVVEIFKPSTEWAQGGPIIEREKLCIGFQHQLDNMYVPTIDPDVICWARTTAGGYLKYGPTPLIAAMRCYVASKLGDEVEIPEELL